VTRLVSLPEAAFVLAATVVGAVLTTGVCLVLLAFAEDVEVDCGDDGGDLPAWLGRCA